LFHRPVTLAAFCITIPTPTSAVRSIETLRVAKVTHRYRVSSGVSMASAMRGHQLVAANCKAVLDSLTTIGRCIG
jgi:hypothetical protein